MRPPIERDPWSGVIALACAVLVITLGYIAAAHGA